MPPGKVKAAVAAARADVLARVRKILRDLGGEPPARAAQLGMSAPHLWRLENADEKVPATETLIQLCLAAGANGDWLLTGRGDRYEASKGGDVAYARGFVAGLQAARRALAGLEAMAAGEDVEAAFQRFLSEIGPELRQRLEPASADRPDAQAGGAG